MASQRTGLKLNFDFVSTAAFWGCVDYVQDILDGSHYVSPYYRDSLIVELVQGSLISQPHSSSFPSLDCAIRLANNGANLHTEHVFRDLG